MRQKGFTLIELMIVAVIVAILAAIALPSYEGTMRKNRRVDAQAALMDLSLEMERHFSVNNTYVSAITGSAPQPPDIYPTQTPLDGSVKFYNLVVTAVTVTGYTLQAQPITGTGQEDDGVLQLTSLGRRAWDRDDDSNLTEAADLCWKTTCQ